MGQAYCRNRARFAGTERAVAKVFYTIIALVARQSNIARVRQTAFTNLTIHTVREREHPLIKPDFCHIPARRSRQSRAPMALTRLIRPEMSLMQRPLSLFWLVAAAVLLFCANAQAQRAQYESLVAVHARANNVPEALVHRVIVRESKYRADLVGRGGTIGLMQIKLSTARGVGYTGTAEGLRDPATNLSYGIKYLAGAFSAANSDHSRAMHYYASGYYYAAKRQRLERHRHPEPVLARAPPKEDARPEAVKNPADARAQQIAK